MIAFAFHVLLGQSGFPYAENEQEKNFSWRTFFSERIVGEAFNEEIKLLLL